MSPKLGISPLTHNNSQSEVCLGLEYKLKDGWKTYWKSLVGGFPQGNKLGKFKKY